MKIRSELTLLTDEIRSATKSWNGGERIKIRDVESTITLIAKDVFEKLLKYQAEEKSLMGCIETAQNLENALIELRDKSINSDNQKDLISAIRKAKHIVSSAVAQQNYLEGKVSVQVQQAVSDLIKAKMNSLEQKISDCAYRTLKNLDESERSLVGNKYSVAGAYLFSFSSLKNELSEFLSTYHERLSTEQQLQINSILPKLDAAAGMDNQFFNLYVLAEKNLVSDDVIEARITNYAYDIEKKIDTLKEGNEIIIPGGCKEHAVVFEIQRVRDNEYHFSIFNTGSGNEFGQSFNTGWPEHPRVPVFTNLSKEAIMDQNFLMNLIRFQVKPPKTMDPVHQAIVEHLVNKNNGVQSVREPHDSQTWGTCTFDSVAAYLEYILPPSLFKPFQFDIMLRARGQLNSLLPQGQAKNIFYPEAFDFIDKKSCETLAEWKKKFKTHCDHIYTEEDVLISKWAFDNPEQKVTNEMSFKRFLERSSDSVYSYHGSITGSHWIKWNCQSMMNKAEKNVGLKNTAFGVSELLSSGPCAVSMVITGELENMMEILQGVHLEGKLEQIQRLFKIHSSEVAKILETRRESLVPSSAWFGDQTNRPVLLGLDLNGVFTYLKNRFSEFALCAPLLNITSSPLQEAMQGCHMLPSAP